MKNTPLSIFHFLIIIWPLVYWTVILCGVIKRFRNKTKSQRNITERFRNMTEFQRNITERLHNMTRI